LKKRCMVGFIIFLLLGLTACDNGGGNGVVRGDVGSVNGEVLDASAYQMRVDLMHHNYLNNYEIDILAEENAELLKQVEDGCFDYMVMEVLLKQEAGRQGVEVDQAKVDAELETLKTRLSVGEASGFEYYLESMGINEKFLVDEIITMTLYDQLTAPLQEGLSVTAEEVRAEYDIQYSGENSGMRIYHVLMIDETEAAAVLQRAKDGEDFGMLAAEYSTDSGTAISGGYVGLGNANSNWVPEFKEAANSLEPDQIYPELVQSTYGYHIIKSGVMSGTEEDFAAQYSVLEGTALETKKSAVTNQWMEQLEADADIQDNR